MFRRTAPRALQREDGGLGGRRRPRACPTLNEFMSSPLVLLAGATGFLGKRVAQRLDRLGVAYAGASSSTGIDMRTDAFQRFCLDVRPTVILNCAAFVGGIQFGYAHPGEIVYNNTLMALNLFEAARAAGVRRVVNPISNCSYPNVASGVLAESAWWDGEMHESVLPYGFARKASWVNAWAYWKQYGLSSVNLILPNMYGPGDHFEAVRSHALGALVKKVVDAQISGNPVVDVWGSGSPVREWLYVDDAVDYMLRAMDLPQEFETVNVGVGKGISIRDLACLIRDTAGYTGELHFDPSKPDGAPLKVMDVSRLAGVFGSLPATTLRNGIAQTIAYYRGSIGAVECHPIGACA